MVEYVLIFLLLLLLVYYYDVKGHSVGYNKWVRFCCALFILFAGLRNHVGGDTFNYIYHFNQWPNLFELSSMQISLSEISQPLWFFVNCLLKTICDDFVVVQIFHAVVVNLLIFRFINRTTDKVFVAILATYCIVWWNFNFEIMRESLCVAIYLNSLLELKKKKALKYILLNIPCLLIHYFSFVVILLTLAVYYLNKKTVSILVVGVALFVLLFRDYFSNLALNLALMSTEDLSERLESYLLGDFYGATSLNFLGIISKALLLIQPLLVLLFYAKRTSDDSLEVKLLMIYMLFFMITSLLPIFSRFLNYLLVIFIIGSINYLVLNKSLKTMSYYAVLLLFAFNVLDGVGEFYKPSPMEKSNIAYDCRYIPYTSVFESPDPTREAMYGK